MKKQYILFVLVLLFATTGCHKGQKENTPQTETVVSKANRKIGSISVLYYNYLVETETPILPDDIRLSVPRFEENSKGVLDANIDDSVKIKSLANRINLLQAAPQPSPTDARLVAVICYDNGSQDTLCLGGRLVNKIFLNGVEQQTDNQLLFLLKNFVGFYPWMIGDDMFAMKELQDNSFPKAPFISTSYYEAYQKALNK